jgi:hypothetical protein
METSKKAPDGYGFTGTELDDLILANCNLQPNSLSAFCAGERRPAADTENARQALASPNFRRAAELLAKPHFRLTAVKGGGALAAEMFSVYGQVSASGMELAALMRPGKTVMVLYFEDEALFLDWWCGTMASKVRTPSVNYLVPELPTEEFAFILHVIDAFRRVYMENMLLYTRPEKYVIPEEDFIAAFKVALQSGDIRWLLPALFNLTPGLAGTLLDIQPGLVETAEALRFMRYEKGCAPGDGIIRFTDAALAMGFEFAAFWQFGLGLQAEVLSAGAVRPMAWEFLAPTNFANHLFTCRTGQMGIRFFKHDQLTYGEYRKHVSGLLAQLAAVYKPAPIPQPVQVPPASPAPKTAFCRFCGAKLPDGAAFCASCGSKLQ